MRSNINFYSGALTEKRAVKLDRNGQATLIIDPLMHVDIERVSVRWVKSRNNSVPAIPAKPLSEPPARPGWLNIVPHIGFEITTRKVKTVTKALSVQSVRIQRETPEDRDDGKHFILVAIQHDRSVTVMIMQYTVTNESGRVPRLTGAWLFTVSMTSSEQAQPVRLVRCR